MKNSFLFLFAYFLFFPSSFSQTENQFTQINNFINREQKNWNIPNVALAIVSKNDVLYQKEYGKNDKDNSQKTVSSNYLIGSVGKTFTALAIMQLVENGKIELDKPVKKYLNWFDFDSENREVLSKITVRNLLHQTSGFPKIAGFFVPISDTKTEIEKEYQNHLSSINIDKNAIGKEHIYCNLNYQFLGEIIQSVSKKSYSDYLKEHIFKPLEMQNTFATYQETQNANSSLQKGYQYFFGFPVAISYTYKDLTLLAGDISSNNEDMAKFLQFFLNEGTAKGKQIISKKSLKIMQTPFSNRYGMGFSIGDWNGLHSIRHTGLTRNYAAMINIFPNQNQAIVILTNTNSMFAVRNLVDGTSRILNNQEKIEYTPTEIYFHYLVGLILLFSVFNFGRRIYAWKKIGFTIHFSKHPKLIAILSLGLAFSLIWVFLIPVFANIPLSALLKLQPDMGYTILLSAVLGSFSAIVNYFIKSSYRAGR